MKLKPIRVPIYAGFHTYALCPRYLCRKISLQSCYCIRILPEYLSRSPCGYQARSPGGPRPRLARPVRRGGLLAVTEFTERPKIRLVERVDQSGEQTADGCVAQVYRHSDGYPESVLRDLAQLK